ncbi:MAG: GNAT family N-acetyltransferase, partial [Luteolibacter sp.]
RPPTSFKEHCTYLRESIARGRRFFLLDVSSEGLTPCTIGYTQANPISERRSELGWVILPEYQGQGWGRKAVDALIEKALSFSPGGLTLEVLASNGKAIHLYGRAGFQEASRRLCLRQGFPHDEVITMNYQPTTLPGDTSE